MISPPTKPRRRLSSPDSEPIRARAGRAAARSQALRLAGAAALAIVLGSALTASNALAQYEQGDSRRQDIEPSVSSSDSTLTRGKLDLNRATLSELEQLPISNELAHDIWYYRTYQDYFGSVYDLMNVEGMTPEILNQLLPLVAAMPPPQKQDYVRRYDAAFRQIQRFLSEEGASEGLTDEYFDQLRTPRNINDLNLYELMTYQNISPVDASAIIRARERSGGIQSARQLRSVDGLAYWGYRNIRDYVVYTDPDTDNRLHGDLQIVTYNTPYMLQEGELLLEPIPGVSPTPPDFDTGTPWGIRGLDSAKPAVWTKLRLRLGHNWKGGITTWRNVGEEHFDETVKWFVQWKNPRARRFKVDRVVAGNFRVAFGQGLVMDNTDFWLARKTGYGFNKRPLNLLGDLSRTYEFALRGAALEASAGQFHGTFFFSNDKKDGIVNLDADGNFLSINRYVLGQPRFEPEELDLIGGSNSDSGTRAEMRRDAFEETLYGGNIKWQFLPATYVGVTAYEAQYSIPGLADSIGVFWDPSVERLVNANDLDILDPRDTEILNGYDSRQLGDFRRVLGAEFQAVYENMAFQGEYAKLDSNPEGGIFSTAPEAWVLNGYVQFENLNILGLYRDYDAGFDNPYMRGFGNDRKYEQTILADPFRLQTPLYTFLERYNPQTKAEKGFFVGLRYRISRALTITGLEYDQWTRVADGQDMRRWTMRAEYAPVFPIRFRLRQRFSSRAEEQLADVRGFKSWDTRLEARIRLSSYDELRLLYATGSTQFVPRPRLSGSAEPDPPGFNVPDNPLAQAGSPNRAIQGQIWHNFNERIQMAISSVMFQGFLWNFEDNEFIVVDGTGLRTWLLLRTRMSDNLILRAKLTVDDRRTRNNVEIRQFNESTGVEGRNVRPHFGAFRLQLDYNF